MRKFQNLMVLLVVMSCVQIKAMSTEEQLEQVRQNIAEMQDSLRDLAEPGIVEYQNDIWLKEIDVEKMKQFNRRCAQMEQYKIMAQRLERQLSAS